VASTRAAGGNRLLMIGALVLIVGVILVLLVLRSGGDDVQAAGVEAAPTGDTVDAEGAATTEPAPSATLTVEELASSRLPLPLPVPEGSEAVALRASFVRGVAAVPQPGDRVKVYRAPALEGTVVDEPASVLLDDVEVLALVGPLPTQNEGEITFLVAVDEAEVPSLLPVARDAELWFTLLPREVDADTAEDAA